VVEIGAGVGALTEFLLGAVAAVVAIEDRPPSGGIPPRAFRECAGLTVLQADVLETARPVGAAVIAGNLPYYNHLARFWSESSLSAPAPSRHRADAEEGCRTVLAARPGSRQYGLLTVLANPSPSRNCFSRYRR